MNFEILISDMFQIGEIYQFIPSKSISFEALNTTWMKTYRILLTLLVIYCLVYILNRIRLRQLKKHNERKEKLKQLSSCSLVLKLFTVVVFHEDELGDIYKFTESILFENTIPQTLEHAQIKKKLKPILPIITKSKGNKKFLDENMKTILHYFLYYMKENSVNLTYSDKELDILVTNFVSCIETPIIANDCEGNSPLGIALTKKRMELVEFLLLECETSVNDCNSLGQTTLHVLIDKYCEGSDSYDTYFQLIEDLIKKGANVNKQDKHRVSPVHLAAKSLDINLLEMFEMKMADLCCQTNSKDELLTILCKNIIKEADELKVLNLIIWLLDRGFKSNYQNMHQFTPLHYASRYHHLSVIKALVETGGYIEAVANDNTNLMHSATMSSNFKVMQYFVKSGVDLYRRDSFYGFSLIHMAALSYNEKNLKWLIRQGFDPHDHGNCDLTPLHLAAMAGNAKVVKILIKLGANVYGKEKTRGCTALHLASMGGEFGAFIQEINVTQLNCNDDLSLVSHCLNNLKSRSNKKANFEATMISLLAAGADVNARDKRGCTPSHYAARCDTLIEILFRVGAYVQIKDSKGYSPLHNTLISKNISGLKMLLTFGANINDIQHPRDDMFEKIRIFEYWNDYYILKHILKLKLAGLPINDNCRSYITLYQLEEYQNNCLEELSKLKECMIEQNVSLYELLHMNFKCQATFIKSIPSNLEAEFPLYHVLIKSKLKEAIQRVTLIEIARTAYQSLTGLTLPDCCIERVFSFLNNGTLETLIISIKE